ncbi:MAG: hypothetical protein ACE5FQ_13745 [Thiogranum sp.]
MNKKHLSKTSALFAASLLTLGASLPISANAGSNPFQMKDLASGYQVAHSDQGRTPDSQDEDGRKHEAEEENGHDHNNKDDHDSKSPEGKCGARHMKENEGKCGGMK